jgi:hypothetical protein
MEVLPRLSDRIRFALDSLVSHRIILLKDITIDLVTLIVDHNSEWDTICSFDRMHRCVSSLFLT